MTQRANPKTGCLTAVVRRLLCSGSQQTHPSDNILDSDETLQLLSTYEEMEEPKKETKSENQTQEDDVSPPPPNVVAKLMGLDNPTPGSNRFRYFDDSGSAVARSKSVNFMDYILRVKEEEEEEDDDDEKDGQLPFRRVRASVSFREIVPTSGRSSSNQQQKKHDFLLMYLDKLDEKRELVGSSRSKRFEKVLEDSKKPPLPPQGKKKENEKVAKKFKDEPRKVAKKKKNKSESRSDHVNGAKKVRWFLSPSKSKSTEKMALLGGKNIPADEFSGKETESPENKSNASPVSVLDRDLYDYLILDDDYYFSGDSESASELATKQVETSAKSSCSSSPSRTRTNTKKENTNSDSEETEFITKLMNMLSDLSEEDMKSSTWVSTSSTKPVDYTQVEEFCVEFGQEILDLVMDQLVDDLLYLV
ncbi:unnamed protein product [Eruca vesicaria subsp. sativa]|uniref:DUF3741 domain-containing protein n=1 Tax=Eruca vesicaria subsp. sativa TaxID=29727 RepID=A0ABC8JYS2_ERUVS|nr:unnamed protein product [Eruca vesicaria subsp. sativa]